MRPMFLLGLVSAALSAQDATVAAMATRAELESAAALRDRWASSTAYSASLRDRARREATAIRARLTTGDFRVGDQVRMRVEGRVPFDSIVAVTVGPSIVVPGLATVDLRGVLRSELQERAQAKFRESVFDATVTVMPLARLAVFGVVAGPGYQWVPIETRVDELLMGANGPTLDSRPDRFQLMRADTVLVTAEGVMLAIANGRTVGDLGMRDGDYLLVEPGPTPWDRATVMGILGLVLTPFLTTILVR